MGRVVTPRGTGGKLFSLQANDPDEYGDRVAKYIPGETLSAYVALQSLSQGIDDLAYKTWWVFVYIVLMIGTVIYIRTAAGENKPWVLHATIAVTAFSIWSYALHDEGKFSPFFFFKDFNVDHFLAGALLIMFTFTVGFIAPKKTV